MPESKGIVSKMLGLLFVIAVVMWVVKSPHDAAQFADNAIALMQRIVVGLLQFFTDVGKQN